MDLEDLRNYSSVTENAKTDLTCSSENALLKAVAAELGNNARAQLEGVC